MSSIAIGEMEIETLENLCKQLKTPEQVVAALQDTNSSKTCMFYFLKYNGVLLFGKDGI